MPDNPYLQWPVFRRSVVAAFGRSLTSIRTGDDLARVLWAVEPYQVLKVIGRTRTVPGLEAFEAWRDYFPGLLIDGAKNHPDVIVPELSNIAADELSGHVVADGAYPPKFINRYTMDRDRLIALFGDRLDEALQILAEYAGNDPYAVRARDAAKDWLDERRRSSSAEARQRRDPG